MVKAEEIVQKDGRWRVAMTMETQEVIQDVEMPLRFWMYGVRRSVVDGLFNELRGRMFRKFTLEEKILPRILNGKCYRSWVVTIEKPDIHRLSIDEWMPLFKSMMESRFRCEVTLFDRFERFLNA